LVELRRCTICGIEKEFTAEFFAKGDSGRFLRNQCKLCRVKTKQASRSRETPERREQRLAKARLYSKIHYDQIAARDYRAEHSERLKQYFKKRYWENRDADLTRSRAWRAKNRDWHRKKNKEWAESNPEKMRGYFIKSHRKRRQDAQIRISDSISAQIRSSIRNNKDGRSWEILVGYSRVDLVAHLERQFVNGMTWGNYGKHWHVDHIIPIDAFSFASADDADFKSCWSLLNLRPLWAKENIIKGHQRTHLL
jgi:hypothetical protein